jgi:transglutaminase-like putative cysteine protease
MKTPPLLIGACILLWGWLSQLLFPALVMTAVLESPRFIKSRWDFSESDIRRISDLCTILLAIVVLIAVMKEPSRFLLLTLQWFPIAVFPLIAVQQYSQMGMIYGRAMLILSRRKRTRATQPQWMIDISYPYFVVCLVAAAGVNAGKSWFYYGLLGLIAWALWPLRSRKYAFYLWLLLLLASGAMGYAGQRGLYRLQSFILETTYDYFAKNRDPFKSTTAIGEVITLKQSSHILFRIAPDRPISLPILLREAGYTAYDRATWYATHSGFEEVVPETDPNAWAIGAAAAGARTLQISMRLPKGRHLLKLPGGAFRLRDLHVARLDQNSLGAVRSESESGLAVFQADYVPGQTVNRPPDDADLKIPAVEAPAIQAIAERLELNAKATDEAIAALRSFFGQHFRYSLNLTGHASGESDLADFLLRQRTGHCEYFATATVLLLRAAGIPARYVSGYAAGEYSPLEDRIVVRQRHAHAWALAYVSGKWVEIDTTPADWLSLESAGASPLVRISDFFAFLRFRLALWRQRLQMEELTTYLIFALVLLGFLFIKRLTGKKHMRRVAVQPKQTAPPAAPAGLTSEFFAIEKWLNRQGHERQPGETFQCWFRRLAASAPEIELQPEIQPLLALHYRYRFGPGALNRQDRQRLISGVTALIAQGSRRPAAHRAK